jgi:hypothetical protein
VIADSNCSSGAKAQSFDRLWHDRGRTLSKNLDFRKLVGVVSAFQHECAFETAQSAVGTLKE